MVADIFKHKFMVQATTTELQSSENFKLQKFWEEKTAIKDKKSMQQFILKIDIEQEAAGIEARETVKEVKVDPVIGKDSSAPAGKYEKAPNDDINNETSKIIGTQGGADDQQVQKLKTLEDQIGGMQAELNGIMKAHSEDEKTQKSMYKWQTSDGDKPGEGASAYSMTSVLLVFLICFGIGIGIAR